MKKKEINKEITEKDFKHSIDNQEIDYVNAIFKLYNIELKKGTSILVSLYSGKIELDNGYQLPLFETYQDSFTGNLTNAPEDYKNHLKLKTKKEIKEIFEYSVPTDLKDFKETKRSQIKYWHRKRDYWQIELNDFDIAYVNMVFKTNNIEIIKKDVIVFVDNNGAIKLTCWSPKEHDIVLFSDYKQARTGKFTYPRLNKDWIKVTANIEKVEVVTYLAPTKGEK